MGMHDFVGSWKLVSVESRDTEGKPIYPYGVNPAGMIVYDSRGNMSVQIMDPNCPRFVSQDQHSGSFEEIKLAFEGYTAYYGTYEINENDGIVIHQVTGSMYPNRIGKDQIRFFKLNGDELTLTTPPIAYRGSQRISTLKWKRM